jgi:hypothetical protein
MMALPNKDRYEKDLDSLIDRGKTLHLAIQFECFPEQFRIALKKQLGRKADEVLRTLPSFTESYQSWYSEAKVLVKQLLSDRLADFVRYYEKPKPRKEITFESYRIEDCLQGLNVTYGFDKKKVAGPDAAIPQFRQQLAILKSVKARFESSLFDIRRLVQADLFDSELDAARELTKNGFLRGAGAVAGVVIEKHLSQVCTNHNIPIRKKHPNISDYNELLKNAAVVDIPGWRQIQRLADIRNLCDHKSDREPSKDEVVELIDGTDKLCKTLF